MACWLFAKEENSTLYDKDVRRTAVTRERIIELTRIVKYLCSLLKADA